MALSLSQVLPNPVDLKAAFCLGTMQEHIPFTAIFSGSKTPAPPEIQKGLEEAEARYQNARERLRAYLQPRTEYLDTASILEAVAQGEKEMKAVGEKMDACAARPAPDQTACVDKARERIKDCYPPNFLPY